MNNYIINSFRYIYAELPKKRRIEIIVCFILINIGSILETISIGAVIPFLAIFTMPEKIFLLQIVQFFGGFFGWKSSAEIILPITFLFILTVFLAAFFRIYLLYFQSRLTHGLVSDFGLIIYKNIIFQPYSYHLNKNSSDIISAISVKSSGLINYLIAPIMAIFNSLILLFFALTFLLIITPVATPLILLFFIILYILISRFVKRLLVKYGQSVSKQNNQLIKFLQEGLGSVRDVIIDRTQAVHLRNFSIAQNELQLAKANIQLISLFPKYLIEAIGIMIIGLMIYLFSLSDGGILESIPLLGGLALAAQRILPVLQQSYNAVTQIRGGQATVLDAIQYLKLPIEKKSDSFNSLLFNNSVEFINVSYSYPQNKSLVLDHINFRIDKGDIVGIIGVTGGGKSTLLDLIIGLIQPSSGIIKVDHSILTNQNAESWMSNISHVPQNIYLTDATILENIAFGIPYEQIDKERVSFVSRVANIHESIILMPLQYDSVVGERGIRLSGGQRQRIGIARALYNQKDFLILDEATSALDIETEKIVLESIKKNSHGVTIVMVAHRLDTLKQCNKIFKISNGHLISIDKNYS